MCYITPGTIPPYNQLDWCPTRIEVGPIQVLPPTVITPVGGVLEQLQESIDSLRKEVAELRKELARK
jgi:hypothetical protein